MTAAAFQATLERHSMPVTECGCWIWLAHTSGRYGAVRLNGRMTKAHRASWMTYRGAIPIGMKVLHRCDVPECINPDHLFLGTQAENIRDMDNKGRRRILAGRQNGRARLTPEQVREIRTSPESAAALARKFGVGKSAVKYARNGDTWK